MSDHGLAEVHRVLGLPRVGAVRHLDLDPWRKPGGEIEVQLRPTQIQALSEILLADGGFLPIGVGHGKTYTAILAAALLDADFAIILIAPATRKQFVTAINWLGRQVRLPRIELVSWGALSRPERSFDLINMVEAAQPKQLVVVADEAHNMRSATAARTKRVRDLLRKFPEAKFVAMSGTLLTPDLLDYAHIADAALKGWSPIPYGRARLAWRRAMLGDERLAADTSDRRYCEPLAQAAGHRLGSWSEGCGPKDREALVKAFGERLRATPGVVVTEGQSCSASLYIERMCDLPGDNRNAEYQKQMAATIASTYRDLEGHPIPDPKELARILKRLAFGYWHKWVWPDEPDEEWLVARNSWASKVRVELLHRSRPGYDTQELVAQAAARGAVSSELLAAWQWWAKVKDRRGPDVEAVWVDERPLDRVVAQAQAGDTDRTLIWYGEAAVGAALRRRGVPVIAPGRPPLARGLQALNVRSHGTGLDLQHYTTGVFACLPRDYQIWEQVIGRWHRQGQRSDEVWVYAPAWEAVLAKALEKTRNDALLAQPVEGEKKLAIASWV